jgi:Na+/H+-dicarboxylate symporter
MKFACFLSRQQTLCRAIAVASRIVHGALQFAPDVFRRGVTCVVGATMRSSTNASLYQIAHLQSFAIWALFALPISLIGTIVPICVEHRPIKLTAPARRETCCALACRR